MLYNLYVELKVEGGRSKAEGGRKKFFRYYLSINIEEGIMPIATINVIPLGTATPSVGDFVADCVKVLKDAGANFEMNAMGTVIDGDLDDILMLVKKMHSVPFEKGVQRVVTTVSIDDRRDKKVTSSEKLESLMERVNR